MNIDINQKIHELFYEERAVWGECPVCHAKPGQKCYPTCFFLGLTVGGLPPEDGAHLGRLQRAPFKIEIVRVEEWPEELRVREWPE